MKKLLLTSIVLLLVSCGTIDKEIAKLTGYSKVCVDNVTYLQFSSGVTVQVDLTGKPISCK